MDADSVVRTLVEVWNSGDFDALRTVMAPRVEHGGGVESVEDHIAWLESEAEVWDSPHDTIVELVSNGRDVAFRWRVEARHVGTWGPVAATGRLVTWEGAHFATVEGG